MEQEEDEIVFKRTAKGEWISDIHAVKFLKLVGLEQIEMYYREKRKYGNINFVDETTGEVCIWGYDNGQKIIELADLEVLAKKHNKQLTKNYCIDDNREIFMWCYKNEIDELDNCKFMDLRSDGRYW
jgi:hypothetical protein